MIRILIKQKNDSLKYIHVSGHANSDDYGKDIVCAAVSVVSQTILLGISEILKSDLKYSIEKGDLSFEIPEDMVYEDELRVNALTHTLMLGLLNIKNNYKNYIDIIKEEV